MKNLLFLCVIGVSYADSWYFGGGIGVGINYFTPGPQNNVVEVRDPAHASLAWRGMLGYNFNQYLAIEAGVSSLGYYENSGQGDSYCDIHGNCGYPAASVNDKILLSQLNIANTINTYMGDVNLKLSYPLTDNFSIFGKAGVSVLFASLNSYVTINPGISEAGYIFGPTINQNINSTNPNPITPIVGAGYSYKVTPQISLQSEYLFYLQNKLYGSNNEGYQGSIYPSMIMVETVINF